MDPTTIMFTAWIGTRNPINQKDVSIGSILPVTDTCQGVRLVRPTFDTTFEVVEDDASDKMAMVPS